MAVSTEEFMRLKKRADKLREDAAKAAGARDAMLAKLKQEFSCDTIEDAEAKLASLREEEAAAEQKYKEELAKFKEQYGEYLEG